MNYSLTEFLPSFMRIKLEESANLQRILANTGWLFADRVLRMCVGLFVGVWIARYLGPKQFGTLNYANAFVVLFSSFTSLGLDGIVVRDIVRDPFKKNEILGTAFILKLLGGIITLLFTVTVISFIRPHDTLVKWLVGIIAAGMIFQAFDTIDFWFQSQIKSKYTVYAKNATFLLITFVKFSLILMKAPLIAFAWAGLAEVAFGSVGLVVIYRTNGNYLKAWCVNLTRAKRLLKDSWPLILSGIAIYIQARIDQVMLGEMIGDSEVGQYSAAMKLIEVFGFIPMVIQSSVAPAVTNAKVSGEKFYYKRLLGIYRLMFILFLITATPIFLFSRHIVVMFYGNDYKIAGQLLSLFAVRLFFTNFGVAKSLFITNENLFRYSLLTATVGSVINVLLNYLLIPKYASVGAVWATIISFFFTTFFIDLFYSEVRRNLKIMIEAMLTPWKLIRWS